jgi:DNA invertase Pin-like site-specific DNA recombinase
MIRARQRVAIYLRVSTTEQTTANQERELREVSSRMGCEVVKVYRDHGISGAKGRDERPQFDRLCRDATKREFDAIMAWSVDRLARSLQDLIKFLTEIHALKIDLYLHQQGLDTTTPAGKAMFQMIEVFAEFERSMIQERVRAGHARAKAEGTRLGRPKIDARRRTRSERHSGGRIGPAFLRSLRNWALGLPPCNVLQPKWDKRVTDIPLIARAPACRQGI